MVQPALACEYPDEGNLPLRRAVTKVRLLPEIEAWSAAARKAGAAVQYALLLEQTLHSGGRCYWTIQVRADGETWRTFPVMPFLRAAAVCEYVQYSQPLVALTAT